MEDIKALYSRIENPIDNRVKWNKLLNIYSTSDNYEDFFNNIVKKENDDNVYYDREDKNNFVLMIWSNFKQKLLSYSLDNLKNEIENRNFESDIYDAIKDVSELESIKSYDNLLKTLSNRTILKYYARMFLNVDKNVVVFSDVNVNKKINFNSLLTVIVDASNLFKVLRGYINQCINNEIDYYIKYEETGKSITLNIYSSIENLKKNESILNVLKKENYTYFEDNCENSLLSGNINEWISIKNSNNFELHDYLDKRGRIIFRSFDGVIYNYVYNHLNTLVSYKGGRMNLIDYLSTYIMEKVVDDLLSSNIRTNSEYFYIANSSDLLNLKDYIKNKLSFSMKDILKERVYLKDGKYKIPLKLNSNKSIDIEVLTIMCAIRNLALTLISKDSSIEKAFRIRIKNECQFSGVDPDKFCLDSRFSKIVFYNRTNFDKYQKELDLIHSDVEKLNKLDVMLNSPNDDEESRKEISNTMQDLLSIFED